MGHRGELSRAPSECAHGEDAHFSDGFAGLRADDGSKKRHEMGVLSSLRRGHHLTRSARLWEEFCVLWNESGRR